MTPKKSEKVRKLVPLKVDVVQRREKSERRLAKRRKVVSDDEEELAHEFQQTYREKLVAQIGGTVVEAEGITLPTSPVEEVRPEEGKKTSGEDVKTLEITFPEFLQDSVVPLLKYLDGKRGKYDVTEEPGFYVPMIRIRTKRREQLQ
ncbi:hypothetical protein AXG93_942s1180 [Marchantia polymorpha subsp. ruderalis]|uniref:Uncharacterized protein n=1 Tax=Marchantia polymorpha subsp. ruderalis TaxID=1480154 RepID=A0A176WDY4_MARPO|nr:hypothetical protein AXG93_942s1180 [Marchantia polymorpha subsp. ruderalis]